MTAPIPTPCIKVCRIDPRTRLCIGCLRSPDEIGGWLSMPPARRAAVMAALPARAALLAQARRAT
jgi:predicted Fe-S protein YdhL (DUF1289 family)